MLETAKRFLALYYFFTKTAKTIYALTHLCDIMQEKIPYNKIKEILTAREEQEMYPGFTLEMIWNLNKEKPKYTRGNKREYTGDKNTYKVDLIPKGNIDEETIRSLKNQFSKRRLKIDKWFLGKRRGNEQFLLMLEFYSVY